VRSVNSATPINHKRATNAGIRNYALVFVGCVFFHIAGTWNLPLIDRDEPRFAEASREMIERGDYVVPYFNNHFRFDKPPVTYWAQIASYKIFGENDFAARLPSVIAAALTALSLLAWGSRLRMATASQARVGPARVGWWSAIIFTLSLQTFLHAKAAVADMWLVLFMTLAHWAGYELIQLPTLNAQRSMPNAEETNQTSNIKHQTFIWWWVFYMSLALGFLAKGPIGWIPLLTVGLTILFLHKKPSARRFAFGRGLLLMLSIVAVWGIPALIQTHGQFFIVGIGRHVIGRSIATMEGHGANSFGAYLLLLPFYFVTVFLSFFPWSIKFPWLIRKLWGEKKAGIIRLRPSSLRSFGGEGTYGGQADPDSNGNKIDNYLIIGIAVIFVIFTLVKTKLPHYTLPAFPLLALLLARRLAAENASRFFRNCVLASVPAYLAIALIVPPFVSRFFPAYQLFQESRTYLRPDMQFASVDFEEPSLVWYFRSPEGVRGFLVPLNRRRAAEFMQSPGPRFVVLPTSIAGTLFAEHPENWKMFSTNGFNIAKGKRVELALALKPE
jgi:4-amino-4-deoxy-L-arabinose transferase-like glycosyltransferase